MNSPHRWSDVRVMETTPVLDPGDTDRRLVVSAALHAWLDAIVALADPGI